MWTLLIFIFAHWAPSANSLEVFTPFAYFENDSVGIQPVAFAAKRGPAPRIPSLLRGTAAALSRIPLVLRGRIRAMGPIALRPLRFSRAAPAAAQNGAARRGTLAHQCQVSDGEIPCTIRQGPCIILSLDTGQINICISATGTDLLANVSDAAFNATIASLSSADPEAKTWSINVTSLAAPATASSTASHAPCSGHISGGAIGGIVVGGIVGIGAIIGTIWYFSRNRRQRSRDQASGTSQQAAAPTQNSTPLKEFVKPNELSRYHLVEADEFRPTHELSGIQPRELP